MKMTVCVFICMISSLSVHSIVYYIIDMRQRVCGISWRNLFAKEINKQFIFRNIE